MSNEDEINAEVVSVFPNKVRIAVDDLASFQIAEQSLRVGSFLKISDNDDVSLICIIENFSIELREKGGDIKRVYMVEAYPLGTLSAGEFRRGGDELAIPPKKVVPATRSEIAAIYANAFQAEQRCCFSSLTRQRDVKVPVHGDRFFNKHIAVIGATGSGKSSSVASILQEATSAKASEYTGLNNSHIVIFDIHGEYKSAFPSANLLSADDIVLPYWLLNDGEMDDMFLESGDSNNYNQEALLRTIITHCKEMANPSATKVNFDTPLRYEITHLQNCFANLARETADADARVHAAVRLDIAPDWTPRGKISITYDWVDAPHVDFLGQRIEFTSKADDKLKTVISRLERTLPGELAKLRFRDQVAEAWASAFTSVELNKANPPVWMRITPLSLAYGGYAIRGSVVTLNLGMKATTETFVGPRPADPVRSALPPVTRVAPSLSRVMFAISVIADYHQLEPVLTRALVKRSRRPFAVPGIGPVNARFEKVTVYGTEGAKIAVGLQFQAATEGGTPSSGTVWLTAKPVNAVDSRRVAFTELTVAGVTDSVRTSLLLKLANAPGFSDTLADALTQNFSKDYDDLLGKITHAIDEKRLGNLVIRAHVTNVSTGQLKAAGQGVYLPVWGTGTASIMLKH